MAVARKEATTSRSTVHFGKKNAVQGSGCELGPVCSCPARSLPLLYAGNLRGLSPQYRSPTPVPYHTSNTPPLRSCSPCASPHELACPSLPPSNGHGPSPRKKPNHWPLRPPWFGRRSPNAPSIGTVEVPWLVLGGAINSALFGVVRPKSSTNPSALSLKPGSSRTVGSAHLTRRQAQRVVVK